jgi:hypothetical protein
MNQTNGAGLGVCGDNLLIVSVLESHGAELHGSLGARQRNHPDPSAGDQQFSGAAQAAFVNVAAVAIDESNDT